MYKPLAIVAVAALSACTASSAMKPYIGQSTDELRIDWGRPVDQFTLADGRRVTQYYWGGGTIVMPANMASQSTIVGNTITTNAQISPSRVIENEGCLVSFVSRQRDGQWIVEEIRYPDRAFC